MDQCINEPHKTIQLLIPLYEQMSARKQTSLLLFQNQIIQVYSLLLEVYAYPIAQI